MKNKIKKVRAVKVYGIFSEKLNGVPSFYKLEYARGIKKSLEDSGLIDVKIIPVLITPLIPKRRK